MGKYKRHIFICMNQRAEGDPRGCCVARGAALIRETFKSELAKRGLKRKVRANQAGCLDACAFGPSVVIYPEGVWYTLKTREDVLEVIDRHIEKGELVEHLLIPMKWAKG